MISWRGSHHVLPVKRTRRIASLRALIRFEAHFVSMHLENTICSGHPSLEGCGLKHPGIQAAIAAAEKAEADKRQHEPMHEYIVQFCTTKTEAEEIMRMLKAHRICNSHYRFYPVKDKERKPSGMDKA